MTAAELLRRDLRLIADLVPEGSRVLDLGLRRRRAARLICATRSAASCGASSSTPKTSCLPRAAASPVVQADLDEGLGGFPDDCLRRRRALADPPGRARPALVLREMLRVGRAGHRVVPELRALAGAALPRVPGAHAGLARRSRTPGTRRPTSTTRRSRTSASSSWPTAARSIASFRSVPRTAGPRAPPECCRTSRRTRRSRS